MRSLTRLLILPIVLIALSPAPTPAQDDEPFLPLDLEPITAENAGQIELLGRLEGRGAINDAIWSPDGGTLTVATGNGVWLYDADDLDAAPTFLEDYNAVAGEVAYSPDGRFLAISDSVCNTVIWDFVENRQRGIFSCGFNRMWQGGMVFSADSRYLFAGTWHGEILVWNVLSVGPQYPLRGHTGEITALARSPDGALLASTAEDHTIRLWDVAGRSELAVLRGHERLVTGLAFSPTGSWLVSGDGGGVIRLWDVASGSEAENVFGDFVSVEDIAFSPDGNNIAAAVRFENGIGSIWLWEIDGEGNTHSLGSLLDDPSSVETITFSPDSRQLLVIAYRGLIRIDIETGGHDFILDTHAGSLRSTRFSPDGTLVAAGSRDGSVHIWDVETGDHLLALRGHTYWVDSIVFSPDSHKLISLSRDGTIRLWNLVTRTEEIVIQTNTRPLYSLALSPDQSLLAAGGEDGFLGLWDVDWDNSTINERAMIPDFDGSVSALAFSPDGNTLALSGILLLNIHDMTEPIPGAPTGETHSLSFSPDGNTLVAGDWDGSVRAWTVEGNNLTEERVLYSRSRHSPREIVIVGDIAFNGDGSVVATIGGGEVFLSGIETDEILASLPGGEGGVSFSPDNTLLAVGDVDGAISLYGVPTDE